MARPLSQMATGWDIPKHSDSDDLREKAQWIQSGLDKYLKLTARWLRILDEAELHEVKDLLKLRVDELFRDAE